MKLTILNKVSGKITAGAHIVGRGLVKIGPDAGLIFGIVGLVGAGVMACVATHKHDPKKVIENAEKELDVLENSQNARKIDILKVYGNTAKEFACIYGPPVAVGTLSVCALLASHGTLKKRYLGAAALASSLDRDFKSYRQRVRECIGDEKEKNLFLNAKEQTVKYIETDEDGNEKVVKAKGKVFGETDSPYTFHWNRETAGSTWSASPAYNEMFLKGAQANATNMLVARRHLLLAEVLDSLGLDRTDESLQVGWLYDENGDCFVDFGMEEGFYIPAGIDTDLVMKDVVLNFNCDWIVGKDERRSLRRLSGEV